MRGAIMGMLAGTLRTAHRWRLIPSPETPRELIRDFLRPALRAVPAAVAARLGPVLISTAPLLERPEVTSRWRLGPEGLQIGLALRETEPHDVALELLLAIGQALWELLQPAEHAAWLELLGREIQAGVAGEIDEAALEAKCRLLAGAASARSPRRLEAYARASFAGTAAEYVHCLWHDVTIRTGPEYLPAQWLRARLELLARWFPPDRGYRLFPSRPPQRGGGKAGASEPRPA